MWFVPYYFNGKRFKNLEFSSEIDNLLLHACCIIHSVTTALIYKIMAHFNYIYNRYNRIESILLENYLALICCIHKFGIVQESTGQFQSDEYGWIHLL